MQNLFNYAFRNGVPDCNYLLFMRDNKDDFSSLYARFLEGISEHFTDEQKGELNRIKNNDAVKTCRWALNVWVKNKARKVLIYAPQDYQHERVFVSRFMKQKVAVICDVVRVAIKTFSFLEECSIFQILAERGSPLCRRAGKLQLEEADVIIVYTQGLNSENPVYYIERALCPVYILVQPKCPSPNYVWPNWITCEVWDVSDPWKESHKAALTFLWCWKGPKDVAKIICKLILEAPVLKDYFCDASKFGFEYKRDWKLYWGGKGMWVGTYSMPRLGGTYRTLHIACTYCKRPVQQKYKSRCALHENKKRYE